MTDPTKPDSRKLSSAGNYTVGYKKPPQQSINSSLGSCVMARKRSNVWTMRKTPRPTSTINQGNSARLQLAFLRPRARRFWRAISVGVRRQIRQLGRRCFVADRMDV
jgi:hypothetical protein